LQNHRIKLNPNYAKNYINLFAIIKLGIFDYHGSVFHVSK